MCTVHSAVVAWIEMHAIEVSVGKESVSFKLLAICSWIV